METIDKEVYFDQYCPTCMNGNLPATQEPCNDCLTYPTNQYSHKPIRYEEDKKSDERTIGGSSK